MTKPYYSAPTATDTDLPPIALAPPEYSQNAGGFQQMPPEMARKFMYSTQSLISPAASEEDEETMESLTVDTYTRADDDATYAPQGCSLICGELNMRIKGLPFC